MQCILYRGFTYRGDLERFSCASVFCQVNCSINTLTRFNIRGMIDNGSGSGVAMLETKPFHASSVR